MPERDTMSNLNKEPYDVSIVVKNSEGKEIFTYSSPTHTEEDKNKLLQFLLEDLGISQP